MTVEPGGGGTIRWIAPEILDGNEISVASDIWAFGMTALVFFYRGTSRGVLHVSTGVIYPVATFP